VTRVLISTAWWPTKSKWWPQYSSSVGELLSGPIDCDLFITTSFSDSKFRSIVDSMSQASAWASAHGFTHILNVEADRAFSDPKMALSTLLSRDKSVVVASSSFGGSGIARMTPSLIDRGEGWGVMLVDVETLNKIPFTSGYAGDYISPDRAWFRKLRMSGVDVWLDFDIKVSVLEPAARTPMSSFRP